MARGINAVQVASDETSQELGTLMPCYIGSAPYWQVTSSDWKKIAGQPFIINSLEDARSKIGYFEPEGGTWPKHFNICEAVSAHFSGTKKYGPIIVLITEHEIEVEEEEQSKNIAIASGTGYLNCEGLAVLSSVSIDGKVKGIDYTAAYDSTGRDIIIKDISGSLGSTTTVKYNIVKNLDELVITSGTFEKLDYFEQTISNVPAVILATGFEDTYLDGGMEGTLVSEKLVEIAEGQINSHWYTQTILQMTTANKESLSEDKAAKGYDSHKAKCCWPYVMKKNGLIYSLSTLFSKAKLIVDISNDNVPCESASNEIIEDVEYICDKEGSKIQLTTKESNEINAIGIATVNFAKGSWRTYGVCMANYLESNESYIDADKLNDVAVQMKDYIANDFQKEYMDVLDKRIPPRVANEIVGDYQLVLNTLVAEEKLLLGNIDYSVDDSNAQTGDFVFDIAETHTPLGKSITGRVKYTTDGLNSYGGDEDE